MANEKKMTAAEIKANAKIEVFEKIQSVLSEIGAEVVGMTSYVPVTVGEQEVWVEVKLTTKQFTDTKVSPAFDPFVAREEYEEDMRIKEEIRKAKEIEKADRAKVKASKSRSSRKIVENSEKEEVQE